MGQLEGKRRWLPILTSLGGDSLLQYSYSYGKDFCLWEQILLVLREIFSFMVHGNISCLLPWTKMPFHSIFKESALNPIALRTAKTIWSFGRSECSRVKGAYSFV